METMFEALYENLSVAYFAVLNLRQRGFESRNISLIVRNFREQRENDAPIHFIDNTKLTEWADYEVITESLTKLLVGTVAISMTGIGPIVAAGPITIALNEPEPTAGGVTAALMQVGVDEDEAEIFNEGIQRGRALVMVLAEPTRANSANTILRSFAPIRILYHQSRFQSAASPALDALSGPPVALLAHNQSQNAEVLR